MTILHSVQIQHTAGCLPGWVRRSALHLHDTAHCRVSTWLSSPVGPPPSWYSTLHGVYLVEFAGRPSTFMIQHTAGCLPGWVRRSALHHHDTAHCRVSTWLSSPVGPPPSWYSTLQGVYLVEFAGRPSTFMIQHTARCLPGWVRRSALHRHDTAHCTVSTWLSSPVGPPPSWYSTLHGVYLVEFAGRPSTIMIQHTAGCLPGWVRRSALHLHDTAHCRVSTWLSSPVGPPPSWYSTLQGVYLVEFAGRPSTIMIQHTAGCLPGWVRRSALHLHDTAHCRVSTWLSSPVGPPPSWYSTLQGVYLVEFAGRPSTFMNAFSWSAPCATYAASFCRITGSDALRCTNFSSVLLNSVFSSTLATTRSTGSHTVDISGTAEQQTSGDLTQQQTVQKSFPADDTSTENEEAKFSDGKKKAKKQNRIS